MKRSLYTAVAVLTIFSGAAFAGSAIEQAGLGKIELELPVPKAVEVVQDRIVVPPARLAKTGDRTLAATACGKEQAGLKKIYAIWIKNDLSYPSDKAIVEREMHRLLKSSADRAELIEVRIMLSNELERVSQWAGFYQGLAYLNIESLKIRKAAVLNERELVDAKLAAMN